MIEKPLLITVNTLYRSDMTPLELGTLAAFQREAGRFGPNDRVALVLCGGNVSADDLGRYAELFKVGEDDVSTKCCTSPKRTRNGRRSG